MTLEWPTATVQYRLNLSNALHPISPALSAFHASRAASLHPELSVVLQPSHCPKCGTYRFSGDHATYPPKRKKRRSVTSPRPKSLLRECRLCGFSIDTTPCTSPYLNNSGPVQPPRDMSRTGSVPTRNETSQESPSIDTIQPAVSTSVPRTRDRQQSHRKSRPKISTLKDMLSRDRTRKEGDEHEKRKEDRKGLAAFLKQL